MGVKASRHNSVTNEQADEEDIIDRTLEQVKKRIRKVGGRGPNEVSQLAGKLSNKERLKKEYFLLRRTDNALKDTFDEAAAFQMGYPNEAARKDSEERIAARTEHVKKLEVTLLLYELKDEYLKQRVSKLFARYVREFTYGPFHAALKIGNLILEWDDSSLVIPHYNTSGTQVFHGNVHEEELHVASPKEIQVRAGQERTVEGFMERANVILDISQEKEYLLDAVAEVVVKYNTKYRYGIFSQNCQHFVMDVLFALGITDTAETFKGKLKTLEAVLLQRNDQLEFNTHEELDDYVRKNIDSMSQEDIEFCHCHYLLFHAWSRKFPDKPAWKCDAKSCNHKNVEQKLINK